LLGALACFVNFRFGTSLVGLSFLLRGVAQCFRLVLLRLTFADQSLRPATVPTTSLVLPTTSSTTPLMMSTIGVAPSSCLVGAFSTSSRSPEEGKHDRNVALGTASVDQPIRGCIRRGSGCRLGRFGIRGRRCGRIHPWRSTAGSPPSCLQNDADENTYRS
jgi:hypothetical protein